jgi:hypothetical protein
MLVGGGADVKAALTQIFTEAGWANKAVILV